MQRRGLHTSLTTAAALFVGGSGLAWMLGGQTSPGGVTAQDVTLDQTLPPPVSHPAIDYFRATANDPVARLMRRLASGDAKLVFDRRGGYLRSLIDALDVPVESQIAVFSKTSLQADLIEPRNPRTIFFNDRVAVAWMRGGFIEIASQDPVLGSVFYTLLQKDAGVAPEFERNVDCLRCHQSDQTLGVTGWISRSSITAPGGEPLLLYGSEFPDHRTPIEKRWGGWYATGGSEALRHLGNTLLEDRDGVAGRAEDAMIRPETLAVATLGERFPVDAYLSPYSDISALLVFDHQTRMANLLTRAGWEARAAAGGSATTGPGFEAIAREVVDYMLFVDEAPLPAAVGGDSGFPAVFAARGPRDSRGRSLRDLDLETRLLRYPLSYMIHSDQFDALPDAVREAIYRRLWQVLSGEVEGERYQRLSSDDRQAIVEILRETKAGLPEWFGDEVGQ